MQKAYMPSKTVAFLLAAFLGGIGAHHIYLGQTRRGVIYLLACVFLSWTFVVPIFLAVLGFCQGIGYLFVSKEDWARQYTNYGTA